MSEQDARDPYLGINNLIREQARTQIPVYYTIGKVISLSPLMIRAAGLNLERDDVKIAQHLLPGPVTQLLDEDSDKSLCVQTVLPKVTFSGRCKCGLAEGDAWVTRPEEIVLGAVSLAEEDEVILIPSADGQIYYVIDKLVEVPE